MGTKPCPSPFELSRRRSSGADAELRLHMMSCARCTETWRQLEALASLGKELPFALPERERRQELHARLVREAERLQRTPKPAPHRLRLWAVLGAAALLVFVLGARALTLRQSGSVATEPWRGTISVQGAARFSHQVRARDEVVLLSDGTIRVEVQPLQPGERFRILIGASEVEVRGTVFDVTARAGKLTRVEVLAGLVAVRDAGASEVVLSAGQSWPAAPPALPVQGGTIATAPTQPSPPPVESSATGVARPQVERAEPAKSLHSEGPTSGRERSPATGKKSAEARQRELDALFGEGFAALRKKQFMEAAATFKRAATAAEQRPIAEDAWYWHAVSLGRAGRSEDAMRALRGFLTRHPRTTRSGEVSCMLGWLLYKAGRIDEAAACFRSAEKDRAPEVRESARLGLAATSARRRP